MQIKNVVKSIFFISTIGLFVACGGGDAGKSKRAGINEVIIQISSNPDKLNIVTASSAVASEVQAFLFETLITQDPKTLEYLPLIAKALPTEEHITVNAFGEESEGLKYSFEIRDEAKFDDGSPITGHDFAFFVKTVKNPKVDCENLRPYFESIIDIIVDAENPKKLAVVLKDKYFLAESIAGGLYALQASKYDADDLMKDFSIRQLTDPKNLVSLSADKKINDFAKLFNSETYARDIILGSGPYTFKSWATGERIILDKNKNWWAKGLVGKESQFNNHPNKVTFEIIVDATTAKTAQKDEGVDLMKHISKDYIDLKEDEKFLEKFKFETPIAPSYGYIGLNTKRPKLADKRVRQALSMAIDYATVKDVFLYGLANRTVSPIHPNKPYYNKNIVPYPYDLQKASALLDEAGWIDSDEDGIRDKEIEGENIPLSLEFEYTSGSTYGENLASLVMNTFAKIGIEVKLVAKEWTVFLEDTKSHNYDMVTMGWVMGSGLSDMKQIWHTESYNGGSNYVGFGNAYTDKLIEDIRFELDEEKRNKMYMEIQEIIHDEAPYIFMFTGFSKIAIHNRFDNAEGYGVRPGYDATRFIMNPSFGAKSTAE
jgi:peptide/nickel transport system substrate-binding protein